MELLGKRSIAWWIKLVLDVSWYVLALAASLVAIFTLLSVLASDPSKRGELEMNVRIEFEPESYQIESESLGVESARIEGASGKLKFQNPGGVTAFAVMGWNTVTLIIVMVAVFQLRKIFASLAKKAPFDPDNARRVRLIGIAIIAGQFAGGFMAFAFSGTFENAFTAEGLAIRPHWGINPFGILFGLMILVFAEVFRQGAEIKEDQDLTV